MSNVGPGCEIWVLPEASHGHAGREARCRVFWGHAGRPGRLVDQKRLSAWVASSGGERLSLEVEPGDNTYHRLRFTPDREGFWAVTVENDVGPVAVTREGYYRRGTRRDYPGAGEVGYYYQYAKTWVQVGHLGHPYVAPEPSFEAGYLGHELELVAAPGLYRAGEEVILEARYRGHPMPGAEVRATWVQREEEGWAVVQTADAAGRAKFDLVHPGHWLFYIRQVIDTPDEEEYDRRAYSATLALLVVR
ncbi:MAG: DUF4198 domain-containing protein [Moorellales bacterium]